ncbi:MAG: hypothetical protein U1C66_01120 [Patescibacteria group bacterium]|nr:hypothetical protein [Patescibacteria group bacterium]
MSTNLIIGIVVALAVVGGGTYVAMNPEIVSNITASFSGNGQVNTEVEGNASVGSTFAQIVALGQSVQCTFSQDDGAGNTSSGTMYIANGGTQMRGDFTTTQSGSIPMESHLVRAGGYTYIWSDSSPQGIKSKVVNEAELSSGSQNDDIDEDTEFNCQAWSIDTAKFTLPTGIEFMEVNVNTGAAGTVEAGSIQAQQCAACFNLPAGAKEQCLAALSC